MKSYICKVKYDNSVTVRDVELLVFAENEFQAVKLCEEKLCKYYDESVRAGTIVEVTPTVGDAYVISR